MSFFEALDSAEQSHLNRSYWKPKRDKFISELVSLFDFLKGAEEINQIEFNKENVDNMRKIIETYLNPPNENYFENHHSTIEKNLRMEDELEKNINILSEQLKALYSILCLNVPMFFNKKKRDRIKKLAKAYFDGSLQEETSKSKSHFDNECSRLLKLEVSSKEEMYKLSEVAYKALEFIKFSTSVYFNHHFSNVTRDSLKSDKVERAKHFIKQSNILFKRASLVNSKSDLEDLKLSINSFLFSVNGFAYLHDIKYREIAHI